uniref:Uncharacterized protein n=1 Tax=Caenorhabditis japonica TaxID=281687 RepID=A0A8R1EEA7_CAEJA
MIRTSQTNSHVSLPLPLPFFNLFRPPLSPPFLRPHHQHLIIRSFIPKVIITTKNNQPTLASRLLLLWVGVEKLAFYRGHYGMGGMVRDVAPRKANRSTYAIQIRQVS